MATKKTIVEPETMIDKIIGIVEKYIDTTGAILDDYLADSDMIMELGVADNNLKEDLRDLEEPETTEEAVIEYIKSISDFDKILETIEDEDSDAIRDFISSKNEGIIVMNLNLNQRSKLLDFINTEIFPHYRDQDENVIS